MLPEGYNKQVVGKLNRIDSEDYFGLLMTTAKNDSIGAVRIIKLEYQWNIPEIKYCPGTLLLPWQKEPHKLMENILSISGIIYIYLN